MDILSKEKFIPLDNEVEKGLSDSARNAILKAQQEYNKK